jgi:phosphoribosyl-AMP cyclohydrolase
MTIRAKWLNRIHWDENGLVPVITQEAVTNEVLMFAWMNRDALARTVELGQAVYWSRSRRKLWHKGEESGHFQEVQEIRVDCDQDVLLLKVKQVGDLACHTGRRSCFFSKFEHNDDESDWVEVDPVLKNPKDIYGSAD